MKAVANLSDEQMLAIPDGFANNIAWNIGHLIVIEQVMIYERCGVDMHIDAESMRAMYWANTSPSDWEKQPDIAALIALLAEQPQQLENDLAAGVFTDKPFAPRTSGSGISISTLDEAIHYNNYHEGMHAGTMLSLLDFI